ncbi:unnamed protein product [Brugia pahangi]|uniref:ZP domain-containing protein n=1 Tax=Brugia pahangi TaxID=6280 RepID=A0A0N4T0Z9_BRUPA|nr:unnamed protein product [Brugia pahangi]
MGRRRERVAVAHLIEPDFIQILSVTQDAATSEDSFNSRNTNINTYPSVQLTTTNYETQLADGKNLGPAPPAAMPITDYSDEQKQIADINFDSTEQNSRVSTDCANIMTTVSVENDETNYAANMEYTFATTSEPIITDTSATTSATSTVTPVTSPCLMQIPHENQQTFPVNAISTTSINETLLEEGRSTTIENTAEKYDTTTTTTTTITTTTTTTTTYLELVDDHSSSIKFTVKPLLAAINNTTLSLHQTTIIPKTETKSEIEMKHKMEIINKNSTIISQPLQISTLSYPSLSPSLSLSPSSFNIHNVIETTSVPLHSTTVSTGIVLNRLRGKARLICKEDGLQFEITTLFPFTGQIFAHNRKPAAECYFTFNEANLIRVTMPYSTCGMRNSGEQRPETQYHMQIIVIFQQKDNTSTMQSFLTQCVHQKVQYQKQIIPKHIEEALEELRLIPTKLEHKAQIPECMMRIVTEEEHGHGDDGTEVDVVNLGQPMRIEWSLLPESGFLAF